jgi:hypothetical protein
MGLYGPLKIQRGSRTAKHTAPNSPNPIKKRLTSIMNLDPYSELRNKIRQANPEMGQLSAHIKAVNLNTQFEQDELDTCPHCNGQLSQEDLSSGWCWWCSKRLMQGG